MLRSDHTQSHGWTLDKKATEMTKEFWSYRADVDLDDDQAREAQHNMSALIEVLTSIKAATQPSQEGPGSDVHKVATGCTTPSRPYKLGAGPNARSSGSGATGQVCTMPDAFVLPAASPSQGDGLAVQAGSGSTMPLSSSTDSDQAADEGNLLITGCTYDGAGATEAAVSVLQARHQRESSHEPASASEGCVHSMASDCPRGELPIAADTKTSRRAIALRKMTIPQQRPETRPNQPRDL